MMDSLGYMQKKFVKRAIFALRILLERVLRVNSGRFLDARDRGFCYGYSLRDIPRTK